MVHVAALLMVKDEEKRIHVSLESLKEGIDSIVIYDTGSTDQTIPIIEKFCKDNNKTLHLKHGTFTNFCESRNVSLEFCETFPEIDFIILLDANDELRGGKLLHQIAEKQQNVTDKTAYLICQKLYRKGQGIISFYNVRFIRNHCGWRYVGSVHEGFELNNETIPKVAKLMEEINLYQDRDEDAEKSAKRYARDKVLLLIDHEKDPTCPRPVYYLAQTCDMMGDQKEAYKWHKLRAEMEGFKEEKFVSSFRTGFLSETWDEKIKWYLKSFSIMKRVEPLVNIAEHYRSTQDWDIGYHFAKLACELQYPENALFYVDRKGYDYNRWELLAVLAFNYRKFEEGYEAINKVLATEYSTDFDRNVKKLYDDVFSKVKINDKGPQETSTLVPPFQNNEETSNSNSIPITTGKGLTVVLDD